MEDGPSRARSALGDRRRLRHDDAPPRKPPLLLIRRGDKIGVRVKDSQSQARRSFHGLDYFPIDPSWRIEARFEPYDPPRSISVPNVLGQDNAEKSPGALVFEHGGKTYRLDPVLERGETDYFVIFGDRTNGTDTYGAGRFLYVHPPVDGKTIIDFNKAYNPPCVFTEYATCPLPPPQNKLPVGWRRARRNTPTRLEAARTHPSASRNSFSIRAVAPQITCSP